MIGLGCGGNCTASTRSGRVHSLPSKVLTRLFQNDFGDLLALFSNCFLTYVSYLLARESITTLHNVSSRAALTSIVSQVLSEY